MNGRCKTCKHWNANAGTVRGRYWSVCVSAEVNERLDIGGPPVTRADFGCVLYKPMPEAVAADLVERDALLHQASLTPEELD